MAKEQDLNNWKQRLNVSHKRHNMMQDEIDMYRRYYQGEQWAGISGYTDRVVDNIIFSRYICIIKCSLHHTIDLFNRDVFMWYVDNTG